MNKFILIPMLFFISAGISHSNPPCVQVDGKPFFIIGAYDYPGGDDISLRHLREMADSGINTIHWSIKRIPNEYPFTPRDFTIRDMDNVDKLGMKVVIALNSVAPWTEKDTAKNLGSNMDQFRIGSELHKRIMKIKDHRALLMYETMDEPGGCREMNKRLTWPSLDTLKACYDFMKSVDTKHPVWCNEEAWFWCHEELPFERFREWSKICDVYSQDDYPEGGPAYPYCPLFVIAEDVDNMMCIVDGDGVEPYIPEKPVLMVLQGQGWNMCAIDRPEIHRRLPNKIETRYVAYTSIIHGAKGIFWWGTRDLAPVKDEKGRPTLTGEFWEIIKAVSREIDSIKDVFVTDRILTGYKLGDRRLDTALFKHDGKNYLVVANKSEQSILDVSINVYESGWRQNTDKKVKVMFEQRKLDVADDITWHDSFGPWDVHVYTDDIPQTKEKK